MIPRPISMTESAIATRRATAFSHRVQAETGRTVVSRGDYEIGRHEAAQHIRVRQALAQRQDGPADSHREHRVDEQQADSAMQRGPFRGRQRDHAKDYRQSACDDVYRQEHDENT